MLSVKEGDGIRLTSYKEQAAPDEEGKSREPEIRIEQAGLGVQQQQDPGAVIEAASRQGASRMHNEQGQPGAYLVGQQNHSSGQHPHLEAMQPEQASGAQDPGHAAGAMQILPDGAFCS